MPVNSDTMKRLRISRLGLQLNDLQFKFWPCCFLSEDFSSACRTPNATKEYNRQKRFQHPHISTFLGIGICNLRFEKAARWQDAVQLFQEIPTARLCPSLVSFNSLISCLEKAGQWQLAVLTLLGMADPSNDDPATAATAAASTVPCVPDLLTFNAAISSCEKGAQWQWAIQIFDMMCLCQLRIAPDAISFNAVISSSTEQVECSTNSFPFVLSAYPRKQGRLQDYHNSRILCLAPFSYFSVTSPLRLIGEVCTMAGFFGPTSSHAGIGGASKHH